MGMIIKGSPKPCRVLGLKPEIQLATTVIDGFVRDFFPGRMWILTALTDSRHSPGSIHYMGLALDWDLANSSTEERETAGTHLRRRLGIDYDVVIEHNHIHVEFQPKQPMNMK